MSFECTKLKPEKGKVTVLSSHSPLTMFLTLNPLVRHGTSWPEAGEVMALSLQPADLGYPPNFLDPNPNSSGLSPDDTTQTQWRVLKRWGCKGCKVQVSINNSPRVWFLGVQVWLPTLTNFFFPD